MCWRDRGGGFFKEGGCVDTQLFPTLSRPRYSSGEQREKSQPQQPESSLLGEAASAQRNCTSYDSSENFDAELNEEQLSRLRKEVTALRQSLKVFTGGVLAAQKRRKCCDGLGGSADVRWGRRIACAGLLA